MILAGRGFGKTQAGAEWVAELVRSNPGKLRIALVGATIQEARAVMVEGVSGLLNVAPDIVDNRYDTYLLPMPNRVETHIVEIATGEEIVELAGFDSSWCRVPPQ